MLHKINKINMTALLVLLIISILINIGLTVYNTKVLIQNSQLKKDLFNENKNGFELLSPDIAWLEVDDFLAKQKTYSISYARMKPQLQEVLTNGVTGKFGLYFEDLTTGAWLGINEKEQFLPVSLMKMPLLVAVLKKVETNNLTLDQEIMILSEDIDSGWGELAKKGVGEKFTVKQLLEKMIEESDNTAFRALIRVIGRYSFNEAALALGLPLDMSAATSPKDYGNMLRALYLSSYLRRPTSELALNIMLRTEFNSQLPAGIPSNTPIAHKVGFFFEEGLFHDCGIIYVPQKPYLVCAMSKGSNQDEADRVISKASRIIYDFVTTGNVTQ